MSPIANASDEQYQKPTTMTMDTVHCSTNGLHQSHERPTCSEEGQEPQSCYQTTNSSPWTNQNNNFATKGATDAEKSISKTYKPRSIKSFTPYHNNMQMIKT
eukprot:3470219-Amphidinium_carterae.2